MKSFFSKLNTKGGAILEYQYVGIIAIIAVTAVGLIGPAIVGQTHHNSASIDGLENAQISLASSQPIASQPLASQQVQEEDNTPQIRYACFNEGIIAGGQAQIRSVNSFEKGFCLHGNQGVWLRNNNIFAFGAVISAPSEDMIYTPGNSNNNEGVEDAFQIAKLDIDIPQTLSEAFNYLIDPALDGRPDYLDQQADVITMGVSKALDVRDLQAGRVYNLSCSGGKALEFEGALILKNVGILTNCKLKFPNNFLLQDTVVATTNTDSRSINSPSGLTIGKNDECSEGGGAQILSLGGMDIAADLKMYGGHLVAAQTINIAAHVDGEGALLLSGKNIEGTSNITMASCGGIGMEDNIVLTWWEYLLSFFS